MSDYFEGVSPGAGLPGTGWIPDLPDDRDYTPSSPKISILLGKMAIASAAKLALPSKVDLRDSFPPVFQQAETNSCTAQAAASLIAYYEKTAFGKYTAPSRLFIYKATRNLLYQAEDRGAFLRSTISALTLFGAPPEVYWPFEQKSINIEPPAFCYAFAARFRALTYYRYEEAGQSTQNTLDRIKANLAAKLPSVFGFYIFPSIATISATGQIPFPRSDDRPVGGHAVTAVGYDDDMVIPSVGRGSTKGAILIRNSWGEGWGESGYGWLPYDYVLGELATDWWSLLSADWVDSSHFEIETGPEKRRG